MKKNKIVQVIFMLLILTQMVFGQTMSTAVGSEDRLRLTAKDTIEYLNIPERLENAVGGSEFAHQITGLSIKDREKAIVREILSGNIPSFSRKLKPLKITKAINGKRYELIFFTTCDYMAIGSDADYLYIPMTPSTAQYLADNMDCSLPTKKMVDIIYNHADVQLEPQPIPPSDVMTTVPIFMQHTDSIVQQMRQRRLDRSADNIIAGHKKDIILSNKIYSADRTYDRVVIYGWHLGKNNPIQPVHNAHNAWYADYSHGVRLIARLAFINEASILVDAILKDRDLSIVLSDEGVISKPNYPESDVFTTMEKGL